MAAGSVHVDTLIVDKDGKVTVDTKRERIEKKKRLAEIVAAHSAKDPLLTALVQSHEAAIRDADNELVHIYEIRDALVAKYGGDAKARKALGLSDPQWSKFGRLCNVEPLRQGRHRGKSSGVLRDATAQELDEARGTARAMIEEYLRNSYGF